jgi:hypothetical protein
MAHAPLVGQHRRLLLELYREADPASVWQTVTNSITDIGGVESYSVTNNATVPSWLYRLRLP